MSTDIPDSSLYRHGDNFIVTEIEIAGLLAGCEIHSYTASLWCRKQGIRDVEQSSDTIVILSPVAPFKPL